jgi:hypothetical protein
MESTINRIDRAAVIELINQYTSDAIGSSEFDEKLQEIGNRSEDETVEKAVWWLWGFYDDLIEHKIVANKAEWDYLQRLQLLLHADAVVRYERRRGFTWRQCAAWVCLAPFASAMLAGLSYWIVAILLGIMSFALGRAGARAERCRMAEELVPFGSLGEIRRVRRSVPEFAKKRYPRILARRRIRGPVTFGLMLLPWAVLWVIFSPLVLLFQATPEEDRISRVFLPVSG